ncbi:MAG TPA: helix-turn-helix domain-containing protein [Anaerolineales bacterium]|nr:helix-turn-helix domain-containing protein [Anaerolineales bacterium]
MIKWVITDIEKGQSGDLLLLTGSDFKSSQLTDATERGVEAVLIIGKKPKQKTLKPRLPTLLIETTKDIRDIQRELVLLISSKNSIQNERTLKIHTQLTKLAADGAELEGLTKAMSEITRHGVLIQDKRLNIIADHPSPDLGLFCENITEKLSRTSNLPAPLQDRHLAGEQNTILTQDISGEISRVIVPIIVNNVARGYLSVIGMEGTLDSLDHLVAKEGSLICAIDMSRTKAVRETEKKLQSDLLTALLQENLSPRDAKLWVEAMGLDQTQSHAALQFSWDSPNPPSRRRLETIINGEVARMGVKVILNPTGDAVICFCQVPPDDNGYQGALNLAQNVLAQASKEYPDARLHCGVGAPTKDLNQWHISFREAGLALDMAARLKAPKPLYYPDLSIYRLLMLLEDNPELQIFKDDTLGSLLTEESNNKFIETLEAYFEELGNLSQTADALFIHRNTLAYRLERIAEITGLDISNPDTALAVQLALKIHRMLEEPGK